MRANTSLSFAALLIGTALTGCWFPGPDASSVEIKTTFGHILDERGWAVGSEIDLYAETEGRFWGGGTLSIEPRGDTDAVRVHDAFDSRMSFNVFNQRGNSVAGTVVAEGEFDVVFRNLHGDELARVTQRASEPDTYALGLLLDDCPEFPDLVMGDEPVLVDGATVFIAPAPLDADGNQLIGHFDFSMRSDADGLFEDGWVYNTLMVNGDATVTAQVGDEVFDFPIRAIGEDEVAGLSISGMPEKHGMDDSSLLTSVGASADGEPVWGIMADWGNGFAAQTTAVPNGSTVTACFNGHCAEWTGAE